ncbi:Crp/Fnr family transcriptional regulator [Sphingomonas sp. 22R3R2A-7]|uniref:Crp/Fnr family transcriptional regulator n=1 Tax=Sphingomonas sp. 22R3R2A-7 TaxID=3050230 RepID=UPI002FE34D1E
MPYDLAPFVTQLSTYAKIDADDRNAILSLPFELRAIPSSRRISYPGQARHDLFVLLEGFSLRQKLTSSGARHISALNIAGDALNTSAMFLNDIDYEVVPISGATVAVIPKEATVALFRDRPAIFAAVFASLLVDAAIAREWLLNVSCRASKARVAHFLCEHAARMTGRGLVENKTIDLGITQDQLSDVLGLTAVHINRTLRAIEEDGLISRYGRSYEIRDIIALQEAADFTPSHLCSSMWTI